MRIRELFSISAAFIILASGVCGHGQNIIRLRDAPFTATQVFASKDSQNINKVARASNGSIYMESFDSQGSPEWVTIEDVPHQRLIRLQVKHKVFVITTRSPANTETYSVKQWMEIMNGPHSQSSGQSDLGTRAESGMTLYGNRLVFQGDVTERWESAELGATYKYTTTDDQGVKVDFTLSNIQQMEPDPALFEIPPGYAPAKVVRRNEETPHQ
jgi:hypothetical protein